MLAQTVCILTQLWHQIILLERCVLRLCIHNDSGKACSEGANRVSSPDTWSPTALTGILYCAVLSSHQWSWVIMAKRYSAVSPHTDIPRVKRKADQYLRVNLTSQTMLRFFLARKLGRHVREIHLTEWLWSPTQTTPGSSWPLPKYHMSYPAVFPGDDKKTTTMAWHGSTNHSPKEPLKWNGCFLSETLT